MNVLKRSICAVSALALAGCATQADMTNLQRDVDEMKSRVVQVDKDLSGIRSSTREDVEKTIKAYQSDLDTLRKGTADIQAIIEATKVDTQVLTGKLDDVTRLAQKPADDIALLREDLDRRLKAVEERMGKMEKSFDDLQKKVAEAKPKEPDVTTPEALYQKSLETLRSGDSQRSREMFSRFVEQYPQHELAANAHYWLGETYFAEKKFDQAILEFQQLIKNFPNKEKVPAAMLKQALAFIELKDTKSARYVLKKLQDEYPFAEEAQKAKEKLKELK